MSWIAASLTVAFYSEWLVILILYFFGGMIITKLIDRIGKEKDASIVSLYKKLFILSYIMLGVATFLLVKELGYFDKAAEIYHLSKETATEVFKKLKG